MFKQAKQPIKDLQSINPLSSQQPNETLQAVPVFIWSKLHQGNCTKPRNKFKRWKLNTPANIETLSPLAVNMSQAQICLVRIPGYKNSNTGACAWKCLFFATFGCKNERKAAWLRNKICTRTYLHTQCERGTELRKNITRKGNCTSITEPYTCIKIKVL